MRLVVFNGSPRGQASNTKILIEQFLSGVQCESSSETEQILLVRQKELEQHIQHFQTADVVLLAFPLYTDAMPGIVKIFIEALQPLCGQNDLPKLGCLVQSGFPEPNHSRYVERYLQKLANRLGCDYLGTIVRGGVEGIQLMPPLMTRKLYRLLHQLGREFGRTGQLDATLLKKLAPREKMSFFKRQGFKVFMKTPLANSYWDQVLKTNGVYEKRFDQPYL